jgi:hypothetical protein
LEKTIFLYCRTKPLGCGGGILPQPLPLQGMKVNEEDITPALEGVQLAITISGEQEVLAALMGSCCIPSHGSGWVDIMGDTYKMIFHSQQY